MAMTPTRRPDDPDVLRGPANWPDVRERCQQERWQAAYNAANGDPDAGSYIEERKAAVLSRLVAEWTARTRQPQRGHDHGKGSQQSADHRAAR